MPEKTEYAIVGGGLTAASAARAIREEDEERRLVVLCAEDELPYNRPPLSKEYLKGEAKREQLSVQPESWYAKRDIELWRGTRVTSIDPAERTIRFGDDNRLEYVKCLVATGGRARRLDLPGADLEGVHTLRTVSDSESIRAEMSTAESVVVVGASFIGMELASAFAGAGLKTTVLEMAPRVWSRITDERLGGFFQRYFEERGVEFRLGDGPAEFVGDDRVSAVRTRDGDTLPCDFAVMGVGIRLNLELLEGAGLDLDDGVVVDDRLSTEIAGLYAAGDVARYPDRLFGRLVRIEHWDNAKAQGAHAGRNMAGADEGYDHMSYFFSDVFDLSLNVVGDSAGYDRVLIRGSLTDASFLAFYLREQRVRAALTVNRKWPELEAAKGLIRAGATVRNESRWTDESVPLEELT